MRPQLRSVLFALIALPAAAACGGDRDVPSPSGSGNLIVPTPEVRADFGSRSEVVLPKLSKLDDKVGKVGKVGKVDEPLTVPTTYVDALALGKALAANGDSARAREVFEAAAKLDKNQPEPHVELARLFITLEERGLAIKSASKAVKLAPESSQAWNTMGRAELARFNYDNAILAFRQSIALNPENVWAWNNLGFTQLQLKHYPEAIDALVIATSQNGATGYMWNNLGTAYEHLDQLDDARVAFENGGALGSMEAKSSRKRLEGVDTIVVMKTAKDEPEVEHTYDHAEPMPPPEAIVPDSGASAELSVDELEVEVDASEVEDDAPKVEDDAPKVKEPEAGPDREEPVSEQVEDSESPI